MSDEIEVTEESTTKSRGAPTKPTLDKTTAVDVHGGPIELEKVMGTHTVDGEEVTYVKSLALTACPKWDKEESGFKNLVRSDFSKSVTEEREKDGKTFNVNVGTVAFLEFEIQRVPLEIDKLNDRLVDLQNELDEILDPDPAKAATRKADKHLAGLAEIIAQYGTAIDPRIKDALEALQGQ